MALANSIGGKPTSGEVIEGCVFVDDITFPAGFTDSQAIARAAPTADAAFDVLHNGSSVGTVTFAAGETDGVFALASDLVVAPGDTLDLQAPSPADPEQRQGGNGSV